MCGLRGFGRAGHSWVQLAGLWRRSLRGGDAGARVAHDMPATAFEERVAASPAGDMELERALVVSSARKQPDVEGPPVDSLEHDGVRVGGTAAVFFRRPSPPFQVPAPVGTGYGKALTVGFDCRKRRVHREGRSVG